MTNVRELKGILSLVCDLIACARFFISENRREGAIILCRTGAVNKTVNANSFTLSGNVLVSELRNYTFAGSVI